VKPFLLAALLSITVGAGGIHAQAIREIPLNPRVVVDLDVSSEVTTLVFPGPLTAIAGAGMLIDDGRAPGETDEGSPFRFHVTHAPASNFVLVRSLRPDASARLTSIYKNNAYVFELQTVAFGSTASAILQESEGGVARRVEMPPSPVRFSPTIGLSLLDRARAYPVLAQSLPRAVEGVKLSLQNRAVQLDDLRIEVQEVYRFSREDALVFLLRLTNTGDSTLELEPATFAFRVAEERYGQSIASGPRVLDPGESAEAEFAVVGMIDGTRHDLSADNGFTILISTNRRGDAPLVPANAEGDGAASE
jgi:hypothetical protein